MAPETPTSTKYDHYTHAVSECIKSLISIPKEQRTVQDDALYLLLADKLSERSELRELNEQLRELRATVDKNHGDRKQAQAEQEKLNKILKTDFENRTRKWPIDRWVKNAAAALSIAAVVSGIVVTLLKSELMAKTEAQNLIKTERAQTRDEIMEVRQDLSAELAAIKKEQADMKSKMTEILVELRVISKDSK
jgi:flagellar motor protein MotB